MVIVNTVVIVQSTFSLPQESTALALAAFGGGSMLAALILPKLLETVPDRPVVLAGTAILIAGLFATAAISSFAALTCDPSSLQFSGESRVFNLALCGPFFQSDLRCKFTGRDIA